MVVSGKEGFEMKDRNRIREGNRVADVAIYILAALAAFITLYPIYYVLIQSISEPRYAATMRVYWWPKGLYFGGYEKILTDPKLWLSYRNTFVYAIAQTLLMLFTCSTAAYALSVKTLRHRKLINLFLLIPMYFSGGIIPLFLLIMRIGLYNTVWSIILPGAYSIWYIILTKAYFGTIPESLREAAYIDGANNYQTLFNVYLPTSKPILAVIALYTIVGVWNSWYHPSIFLPDQSLQPLQLYLRRILIEQSVDLSVDLITSAELAGMQKDRLTSIQLKYTVIIVSSLPMIIAYPFFQKYFVKGVMLGSLKE